MIRTWLSIAAPVLSFVFAVGFHRQFAKNVEEGTRMPGSPLYSAIASSAAAAVLATMRSAYELRRGNFNWNSSEAGRYLGECALRLGIMGWQFPARLTLTILACGFALVSTKEHPRYFAAVAWLWAFVSGVELGSGV